jgi:hypothetical protein
MGPYASVEGGSESEHQYWKDALQLAAHEVGARPASDKIPGLDVTTPAGRRYLETSPAFQVYQPPEGLDQAAIRAAVFNAIKARMREIHTQLVNKGAMQAGQ